LAVAMNAGSEQLIQTRDIDLTHVDKEGVQGSEVSVTQDVGEVHFDSESPGEMTVLTSPKSHPLDEISDQLVAPSSLPSAIVRPQIVDFVPLAFASYALTRIQVMLQAYVYIVVVQTYLLHLYALILHLLSGSRVLHGRRRI